MYLIANLFSLRLHSCSYAIRYYANNNKCENETWELCSPLLPLLPSFHPIFSLFSCILFFLFSFFISAIPAIPHPFHGFYPSDQSFFSLLFSLCLSFIRGPVIIIKWNLKASSQPDRYLSDWIGGVALGNVGGPGLDAGELPVTMVMFPRFLWTFFPDFLLWGNVSS